MRILHIAFSFSYWGRLSRELLDSEETQVAGSESAMLHAVYRTPTDVTLVGDVETRNDGHVKLRHISNLPAVILEDGPYDFIVCWTDAERLIPYVESGAINPNETRIVVANQCTNFAGFTQAGASIVSGYVFPSEWHADFMSKHYGLPRELCNVIPNAVCRSWPTVRQRDPYRVYHASSPDRGLHHLLAAWPLVKAAEPRAKLDVFYELERYLAIAEKPNAPIAYRARGVEVRAMAEVVKGIQGVTLHGAKGQAFVRRTALSSGVMAYPCDPLYPTETFGSAVLEAYHAGCKIVLTDADCFGSLWRNLLPLMTREEARRPKVLAGRILEAMAEAAKGCSVPRKTYDFWDEIGEKWMHLFQSAERREPCAVAATTL